MVYYERISFLSGSATWGVYKKVVNEKREIVQKKEEKIFLWLEIPKIGLKREVYSLDSEFNDVDKYVELLEESNLEQRVLFLASHSGHGEHSYFNDLIYLEKGDLIWVIYDQKRMSFVVDETYFIPKTGYLGIDKEDISNVLYLITCSLIYSERQLVIHAKYVC